MFPTIYILSSLAFFSISYPLTSFLFHDTKPKVRNNRKRLLYSLVAIFTIFAVKLGYEFQNHKSNYYQILEINRHSSTLEIRQAYKKVSKKLHPDKSTAIDAEEKFQSVKKAYDVLMDESQRQIYNRFGEESLEFDPRLDELKLLSEIIIRFIGWGIAAYIYTLPAAAKSCRTWIAITALILLALEITFCLTETSIPAMFPPQLTEREFILLSYSVFPLIIAVLRCLSEAFYVDIDKSSFAVLRSIAVTQTTVNDLLLQLQEAVDNEGNKSGKVSVADIDEKIKELRSVLDFSNNSTLEIIDDLTNSSSNLGANYYWLVFIAMYGGIYLLQS